MLKDELLSEVASRMSYIEIDFGGGCSVAKGCLMAWLIRRHRLERTLEIGVYRGRSFFPQAHAHLKSTGGTVYGIDPYDPIEALEYDNLRLKSAIETHVEKTDYQVIFDQVQSLIRKWGYQQHCVLLRQASAKAINRVVEEGLFFDMLHIDGNHDTEKVISDVALYVPRVRRGGFVVMDDISWASVRPAYRSLTKSMSLICEHVDQYNDYALLWNGVSRIRAASIRAAVGLFRKTLRTRISPTFEKQEALNDDAQ